MTKVPFGTSKIAFSNPEILASWELNFDCCDWYGVECNETTNLVTSLTLISDHLSGTIPQALSNLTHLEVLRLHKIPNLVGEIPPTIGDLANLIFLEISWTNISRQILIFLTNLKKLKFLDLSFNNLSGSIPPSLATLPLIYAINFSRNHLTGSIPESFGHFRETVAGLYLMLSHNKLGSEIPPSLARTNFYRVDISRNNFSGDASMFFGTSKPTGGIDISRNNFEFNFSKVSFMEELFGSDILHNKIYENIPEQITNSIYLQSLNVMYNRLCGEIPTGWKLKYRSEPFDNSSYLHNRCLCGIPLNPCKKKL